MEDRHSSKIVLVVHVEFGLTFLRQSAGETSRLIQFLKNKMDWLKVMVRKKLWQFYCVSQSTASRVPSVIAALSLFWAMYRVLQFANGRLFNMSDEFLALFLAFLLDKMLNKTGIGS